MPQPLIVVNEITNSTKEKSSPRSTALHKNFGDFNEKQRKHYHRYTQHHAKQYVSFECFDVLVQPREIFPFRFFCNGMNVEERTRQTDSLRAGGKDYYRRRVYTRDIHRPYECNLTASGNEKARRQCQRSRRAKKYTRSARCYREIFQLDFLSR